MRTNRVWLAAVLGVALVAGCPNTGGPGPGAGSGAAVSDEERLAALDTAAQLIAPIELNGDPANSEQIAALLSGMTEFDRVEVHDDTILARFKDGQILTVLNNRGPGENPDGGETAEEFVKSGITKALQHERTAGEKTDAGRRQSAARSNRIPESKSALLVNAMGNAYKDSTGEFAKWLSDAGYAVTRVEGTVEGLRTGIQDAGVLYMSAHGGAIPRDWLPQLEQYFPNDANTAAPDGTFQDARDHFTLWTTTPVTEATLKLYKPEVDAGLLTYTHAPVNRVNGVEVEEWHFVITEAFVRKYWRCREGALIYMDACSSAKAGTLLKDVCLGSDVNASAYVGWTLRTYDRYATPTARYFFDRTLGVNRYEPVRTPPQRPFSTNKTIAAMSGLTRVELPLDTSPKSLFPVPEPAFSKLVALYDSDTQDVLLRPAIQSLAIADTQGKLTVEGHFGDETGTVTVDGTPLTLRDGGWTSSRIECDIPQSRAGSSGAVVVEARQRDSNPRRLTQWDMTFRRLFMDFPTQLSTDCPACFYEATLHCTFRADMGTVRLAAEEDVSPPGGTGSPSRSDIEVTNAGGSYPIGQGSTIALSPNPDDGAESIGTCVGFAPPPSNNFVGACFTIQGADGRILFSPTFTAEGLFRTYIGGTFDGTVDPYDVTYSGNLLGNELPLNYTPNLTITAGNQATGANSYFEWDAADAKNPPAASDPN